MRAMPSLAQARVKATIGRGPVSTVWLLDSPDGELVLKIGQAAASRLGIDPVREFGVLRELEPWRLGPRAVAVDSRHRALVTRLVPGERITTVSFERDLSEVGGLLARLHAVPAERVPGLDLRVAVGRYATAANCSAGYELLERANALLATRREPRRLCLCHNDVHAGNLVRHPDKGLVLLDWEYAGLGDPAFDLAVLVEHNALSGPSVSRLVEGYVAAGGEVEDGPDSLRHARALYGVVRQLWELAIARLEPDLAGRACPVGGE